MSDAEDGGPLELLADESLRGLLGDYVDISGGLVEDDDLVAAEDSSDDADELALTNAQVLALFFDLEVESLVVIADLFFLLFSVFLWLGVIG